MKVLLALAILFFSSNAFAQPYKEPVFGEDARLLFEEASTFGSDEEAWLEVNCHYNWDGVAFRVAYCTSVIGEFGDYLSGLLGGLMLANRTPECANPESGSYYIRSQYTCWRFPEYRCEFSDISRVSR